MIVVVLQDQQWTVSDRTRTVHWSRSDIETFVADPARLRAALTQSGFRSRHVWVALPRSAAVVRLLELPTASDSDIAGLVALQLESLAAGGACESLSDHVRLEAGSSSSSKRLTIQAASVAKSLVEEATSVWKNAGLRVAGVTVGPHTLTALSDAKDHCQIMIAVDGNGADVVITVDRQAAASQSVRCDWSDPRQTARHIKSTANRLCASLPQGMLALPTSAWVCVPDAIPGAIAALQDELQIPLHRWAGNGTASADRVGAIASGVHRSLATRQPLLNFVSPRRATPSSATLWRKYSRAAAAAAALAAVGGALWFDEHLNLADQQQRRQTRLHELKQLVNKGQHLVATESALREWSDRHVDWSRELHQFGNRLPDSSQLVISRLDCGLDRGSGLPVVRAAGIARDPRVVLDWQNQLIEQVDKYELHPHGLEPNAKDPLYFIRFEVEATINAPDIADEPPLAVSSHSRP